MKHKIEIGLFIADLITWALVLVLLVLAYH